MTNVPPFTIENANRKMMRYEMKKVAIVTDSACNLSAIQLEQHGIYEIPLRLNYRGKEFRDGVDITVDEVYALQESEHISTSLPSPEDILALYERLAEDGITHVIHICVSSALSGTYNTVSLLAKCVEGIHVYPIDSRTISLPQGLMVMECAQCLQDTGDIDTAIKHALKVRENMEARFCVSNLEQLYKSGRLGRLDMLVGTTLQIRPILTINREGALASAEKVRGFQRASETMIRHLFEQFGNEPVHTALVYGNSVVEAEKLRQKGLGALHVCDFCMSQVTPILGVHTGPSILGFVAYTGGWKAQNYDEYRWRETIAQ